MKVQTGGQAVGIRHHDTVAFWENFSGGAKINFLKMAPLNFIKSRTKSCFNFIKKFMLQQLIRHLKGRNFGGKKFGRIWQIAKHLFKFAKIPSPPPQIEISWKPAKIAKIVKETETNIKFARLQSE